MATLETIAALRQTLTSESEPLARRYRALFSLKHVASLHPPTDATEPAIDAIAAALFTSSSELLKHELAYCLGQSRQKAAVPYLRRVLEDRSEHAMCRHEAAEALGALGFKESLDILKEKRDDPTEPVEVRETCDIAVDRIEWETSGGSSKEDLKKRSVTENDFVLTKSCSWDGKLMVIYIYKVISLLSTQHPRFQNPQPRPSMT